MKDHNMKFSVHLHNKIIENFKQSIIKQRIILSAKTRLDHVITYYRYPSIFDNLIPGLGLQLTM